MSEWMVVAALAVTIRTMVISWGYSGAGISPMFGDFEAQRHWLEITIALPIGDWYRQTEFNDLQYWGLDYPPLTAYVSYAFGRLAEIFRPEVVKLFESRGHESPKGKAFMRATVIFCDILILIPAVLVVSSFIFKRFKTTVPNSKHNQSLYTLSCLLLPGLLLIDHGHFQYNGVCLALALWGAYFILNDRNLLGSVFFCLSLNFKQMSLYYAPVFFFALLRKCYEKKSFASQITTLIKIGLTVLLTFGVLWAPFCIFHASDETCASSLLHVLSRQFPFSRGIFEDKVSNLWYTLSVFVDIRQYLTQSQLVFCSLGLTLLLLSPVCVDLLRHKMTPKRMLLALVNSSLAFFLASYQVHEKSILLSLFPLAFLLPHSPLYITFTQLLGCFTMFPLLKRDKLVWPYIALNVLYAVVVFNGVHFDAVCEEHDEKMRSGQQEQKHSTDTKSTSTASTTSPSLYARQQANQNMIKNTVIALGSVGMITLHILEFYIPAPVRYPDLYPALFAMFGALNLLLTYVGCLYWQWSLKGEEMLEQGIGEKGQQKGKNE